MVACPHQLASIAGLYTLQKGGNAVDAAISINSTLGVVYPHMTGVGGDSFWLIYDAKTRKVYGLNGSGRSAQAATCDFYRSQGLKAIPTRGPLAAITVPGTVDAWTTAQARFGRLSLSEVLEPAIQYAESGYPASESQVNWTGKNEALLSEYPFSQKVFLPGGQVPKPGAVLSNPGLANTLRSIARDGRDAFYRGEIAEEIVRSIHELGGILTQEDFATHYSDWVNPITTTYRGYTICEMPPNTQGFSVLQILNLLEGFDLQAIGHGTADYYHLIVEATKAAFADRDRWLTDPDFVQIPIDRLIDKVYAEERRQQIDLKTANSYQPGGMGGDTTFSAVVDAEGNAVAMIQSLYFDYGCGIVAGETGIVLQNRGAFFSLDETHANCLQPGKRTFHTLIPAMALNANGKPELVFGTMGGEGQPQTQVAMLTRLIDYGFDPQTAIDLPRWLYGRTWGANSSALSLEGRIDSSIANELAKRGHPVQVVTDWTEQMGHAQMIRIDPTTGILQGGCDPRSDGIAVGY
jgi:gamma-glutamyltranspeptidase